MCRIDFLLLDLAFFFRNRQISLVCYGLGSFSTCPLARCQLAWLALFLEEPNLNVRSTLVYDPVFTFHESQFLQQTLHCVVPTPNDRCLHRASESNSLCTVFYMPHCSRGMYNNVLHANWRNLGKICIIGNYLKNLCGNALYTEEHFSREFSCLNRISTGIMAQFFTLPEFDRCPAAFNDTCFNFFNSTNESFNHRPGHPNEPVYTSNT